MASEVEVQVPELVVLPTQKREDGDEQIEQCHKITEVDTKDQKGTFGDEKEEEEKNDVKVSKGDNGNTDGECFLYPPTVEKVAYDDIGRVSTGQDDLKKSEAEEWVKDEIMEKPSLDVQDEKTSKELIQSKEEKNVEVGNEEIVEEERCLQEGGQDEKVEEQSLDVSSEELENETREEENKLQYDTVNGEDMDTEKEDVSEKDLPVNEHPEETTDVNQGENSDRLVSEEKFDQQDQCLDSEGELDFKPTNSEDKTTEADVKEITGILDSDLSQKENDTSLCNESVEIGVENQEISSGIELKEHDKEERVVSSEEETHSRESTGVSESKEFMPSEGGAEEEASATGVSKSKEVIPSEGGAEEEANAKEINLGTGEMEEAKCAESLESEPEKMQEINSSEDVLETNVETKGSESDMQKSREASEEKEVSTEEVSAEVDINQPMEAETIQQSPPEPEINESIQDNDKESCTGEKIESRNFSIEKEANASTLSEEHSGSINTFEKVEVGSNQHETNQKIDGDVAIQEAAGDVQEEMEEKSAEKIEEFERSTESETTAFDQSNEGLSIEETLESSVQKSEESSGDDNQTLSPTACSIEEDAMELTSSQVAERTDVTPERSKAKENTDIKQEPLEIDVKMKASESDMLKSGAASYAVEESAQDAPEEVDVNPQIDESLTGSNVEFNESIQDDDKECHTGENIESRDFSIEKEANEPTLSEDHTHEKSTMHDLVARESVDNFEKSEDKDLKKETNQNKAEDFAIEETAEGIREDTKEQVEELEKYTSPETTTLERSNEILSVDETLDTSLQKYEGSPEGNEILPPIESPVEENVAELASSQGAEKIDDTPEQMEAEGNSSIRSIEIDKKIDQTPVIPEQEPSSKQAPEIPDVEEHEDVPTGNSGMNAEAPKEEDISDERTVNSVEEVDGTVQHIIHESDNFAEAATEESEESHDVTPINVKDDSMEAELTDESLTGGHQVIEENTEHVEAESAEPANEDSACDSQLTEPANKEATEMSLSKQIEAEETNDSSFVNDTVEEKGQNQDASPKIDSVIEGTEDKAVHSEEVIQMEQESEASESMEVELSEANADEEAAVEEINLATTDTNDEKCEEALELQPEKVQDINDTEQIITGDIKEETEENLFAGKIEELQERNSPVKTTFEQSDENLSLDETHDSCIQTSEESLKKENAVELASPAAENVDDTEQLNDEENKSLRSTESAEQIDQTPIFSDPEVKPIQAFDMHNEEAVSTEDTEIDTEAPKEQVSQSFIEISENKTFDSAEAAVDVTEEQNGDEKNNDEKTTPEKSEVLDEVYQDIISNIAREDSAVESMEESLTESHQIIQQSIEQVETESKEPANEDSSCVSQPNEAEEATKASSTEDLTAEEMVESNVEDSNSSTEARKREIIIEKEADYVEEEDQNDAIDNVSAEENPEPIEAVEQNNSKSTAACDDSIASANKSETGEIPNIEEQESESNECLLTEGPNDNQSLDVTTVDNVVDDQGFVDKSEDSEQDATQVQPVNEAPNAKQEETEEDFQNETSGNIDDEIREKLDEPVLHPSQQIDESIINQSENVEVGKDGEEAHESGSLSDTCGTDTEKDKEIDDHKLEEGSSGNAVANEETIEASPSQDDNTNNSNDGVQEVVEQEEANIDEPHGNLGDNNSCSIVDNVSVDENPKPAENVKELVCGTTPAAADDDTVTYDDVAKSDEDVIQEEGNDNQGLSVTMPDEQPENVESMNKVEDEKQEARELQLNEETQSITGKAINEDSQQVTNDEGKLADVNEDSQQDDKTSGTVSDDIEVEQNAKTQEESESEKIHEKETPKDEQSVGFEEPNSTNETANQESTEASPGQDDSIMISDVVNEVTEGQEEAAEGEPQNIEEDTNNLIDKASGEQANAIHESKETCETDIVKDNETENQATNEDIQQVVEDEVWVVSDEESKAIKYQEDQAGEHVVQEGCTEEDSANKEDDVNQVTKENSISKETVSIGNETAEAGLPQVTDDEEIIMNTNVESPQQPDESNAAGTESTELRRDENADEQCEVYESHGTEKVTEEQITIRKIEESNGEQKQEVVQESASNIENSIPSQDNSDISLEENQEDEAREETQEHKLQDENPIELNNGASGDQQNLEKPEHCSESTKLPKVNPTEDETATHDINKPEASCTETLIGSEYTEVRSLSTEGEESNLVECFTEKQEDVDKSAEEHQMTEEFQDMEKTESAQENVHQAITEETTDLKVEPMDCNNLPQQETEESTSKLDDALVQEDEKPNEQCKSIEIGGSEENIINNVDIIPAEESQQTNEYDAKDVPPEIEELENPVAKEIKTVRLQELGHESGDMPSAEYNANQTVGERELDESQLESKTVSGISCVAEETINAEEMAENQVLQTNEQDQLHQPSSDELEMSHEDSSTAENEEDSTMAFQVPNEKVSEDKSVEKATQGEPEVPNSDFEPTKDLPIQQELVEESGETEESSTTDSSNLPSERDIVIIQQRSIDETEVMLSKKSEQETNAPLQNDTEPENQEQPKSSELALKLHHQKPLQAEEMDKGKDQSAANSIREEIHGETISEANDAATCDSEKEKTLATADTTMNLEDSSELVVASIKSMELGEEDMVQNEETVAEVLTLEPSSAEAQQREENIGSVQGNETESEECSMDKTDDADQVIKELKISEEYVIVEREPTKEEFKHETTAEQEDPEIDLANQVKHTDGVSSTDRTQTTPDVSDSLHEELNASSAADIQEEQAPVTESEKSDNILTPEADVADEKLKEEEKQAVKKKLSSQETHLEGNVERALAISSIAETQQADDGNQLSSEVEVVAAKEVKESISVAQLEHESRDVDLSENNATQLEEKLPVEDTEGGVIPRTDKAFSPTNCQEVEEVSAADIIASQITLEIEEEEQRQQQSSEQLKEEHDASESVTRMDDDNSDNQVPKEEEKKDSALEETTKQTYVPEIRDRELEPRKDWQPKQEREVKDERRDDLQMLESEGLPSALEDADGSFDNEINKAPEISPETLNEKEIKDPNKLEEISRLSPQIDTISQLVTEVNSAKSCVETTDNNTQCASLEKVPHTHAEGSIKVEEHDLEKNHKTINDEITADERSVSTYQPYQATICEAAKDGVVDGVHGNNQGLPDQKTKEQCQHMDQLASAGSLRGEENQITTAQMIEVLDKKVGYNLQKTATVDKAEKLITENEDTRSDSTDLSASEQKDAAILGKVSSYIDIPKTQANILVPRTPEATEERKAKILPDDFDSPNEQKNPENAINKYENPCQLSMENQEVTPERLQEDTAKIENGKDKGSLELQQTENMKLGITSAPRNLTGDIVDASLDKKQPVDTTERGSEKHNQIGSCQSQVTSTESSENKVVALQTQVPLKENLQRSEVAELSKGNYEINEIRVTSMPMDSSGIPAQTSKTGGDATEKEEKTVLKEEKPDEKEAMTEEQKSDEEKDGSIQSYEDLEREMPITAEALGEMEVKATQKKSHNILSGVGSKVKHSISKMKKAIACSSAQFSHEDAIVKVNKNKKAN